MNYDERSWLGDPGALVRRKRVVGSETAVVARARGVRPFPMAAAKVLSLTSGSNFDVNAVVAAIETDVALAARVLRLVNSSAFALRSRCSSLRQAVLLLGAGGVREAVVAGAVLNMFPGATSNAWLSLQKHALTTAALARHLAPEWRLPSDDMFTVAFLHDIGKWILLEQEADYEGVLAEHGTRPEATLDEERGRYGFDHAELTEHLLHAWAFPKTISRVAGLHHDPADGYSDSLAPRVALLRFSNILAHAILEGTTPDFDALASTEPMTYLDVSAQWLRERFAALSALGRGDTSEAQHAPLAGDHAMVSHFDDTAQKATDVCGYCDLPAFNVHCRRCDTLVCDIHVAGNDPPVCMGCARELEGELRTASVSEPRRALVSLALGVVTCVFAVARGGWEILFLAPAAAFFVYAFTFHLRRAQIRRRFLAPR